MKKLCGYGCGQEAKFYFKTVDKWCCSSHWLKCKNQRKRFSGEGNPFYSKSHTKEYKKKRSEVYKGKNNPRYGRECSKETKFKIRNSIRLTIKQIKKRFPFFSKIEEMRYNPDKSEEKEIQVHCKNHICPNSKEKNGWFTPTSIQFKNRKDWLENEGKDLCYFYCSKNCKDSCPLYHSKGGDPLKNDKQYYTQEEYKIFRKFVLERDNYKCQYCDESATDVHHERPQKLEPLFVLDPDFAWSCCKDCHYKYGHKTETKCSTGSLAVKVCK